nr:aspartic proteinase PCS1-like [Tanacetum cinerariifolium]
MVLDTGSELTWLHCKKTQTQQLSYDPIKSTSYKPIPCSSPVCMTRTQDFSIPASCDPKKLCHATLSYADATSVEGNLAYETFHFQDSNQPGVIFGCMDTGSSTNQEEDSKTTGLMGMNRGSLSFVTQMSYPKFSYCISGQDTTGVLIFGEFNATWLPSLTYTPMVRMSTPLPYYDRVAYTVQLEGIKVSGTVLPLPKSIYEPDHTGAGQTMIDSGTQFTFLLGPVYTALKNEFIKQTRNILRFNATWLPALTYTPMVRMSTPLPYYDRVAYTVQLEGIKVSGTVLPLPKSIYEPDHTGAGQTMIDSGTQFTFLLGPVYTALKNEFIKQTRNILRVYEDTNFVFQGAMDLCYRVEQRRVGLPVLPNVSMMFRGSEMMVSGQKLLYKVNGLGNKGDDIYCFTFGNSDLLGIEAYVIGHHHQENMWMEFDVANNRVGFAEVRCDSVGQKLGADLL